ncbi:hypothetical protein K469DRAFT_688077 [Zopfia rhizophila CBS 207.26]|uniref:Uncharacterized protein n=1 Tax=Zopfia rhizophila CBS 207.26 TaxID=1314779 RepID=A0A6A6E2N5_9PEZI|nr:hypothetical protein K469DRAFT_688077 [Zopfia rhizophila CBS 207.26]
MMLEAKKGSNSNGFKDIQAQTAFPIWALLKLQEDLQSHLKDSEECFDPFVWLLASRGDVWRVYGCYLTKGVNSEPTKYDIFLLWHGSVLFKDNALQLILIINYILDWARDAYRRAILRQLKSIATGKAYDQVSLTVNTDAFSMRRNISNWMPAPPSNTGGLDLDDELGIPILALEHQSMLSFTIPNTRMGPVRSALLTDYHFVCLYLNGINVTSLLQLAAGPFQNIDASSKAARDLVNQIGKWDELLTLTGAAIDDLEYIWTGKTRSDSDEPSPSLEEVFFIILKFRGFISSS